MKLKSALAALLLASSALACAQLRLPNTFSDHAVVQRERPIRVYGWALPGEQVSIAFHQQNVKATADVYGYWETTLAPEAAGGPYTLTASGDEAGDTPVTRQDILIGDVWLASGQSNMEMPLRGFPSGNAVVKDAEKEIASATHPRIRLLVQTRRGSTYPLEETDNTWTECTPDTVRTFSAIGYFFAREIEADQHVPIGVIDATGGGTPVEAWTSLDMAAELGYRYEMFDRLDGARLHAQAAATAERKARLSAADKAGHAPATTDLPHDLQGVNRDDWAIGSLYNGMIAPYARLAVRGVLWYQGETDTNALMAPEYRYSFPALIEDWRSHFGEPTLPFLFVQLAGFTGGEGWPVVRDAQRRTEAERRATGMAVALDVGMEHNIHPADKQTVAHRLALLAREQAYGEKLDGHSPALRRTAVEGSAMRVYFDHAEHLKSSTNGLGNWELQGEDGRFHAATARIERSGKEDTVVVESKDVKLPRAVRYAWRAWATSFVYNDAGLPLGTFTSLGYATRPQPQYPALP
ncbi:sialate O-acetylesterase [Granulicella cerasi]|uniref:Sialate O-acetylesterase n=1 Tax=Granulicella cerasi TaxID=741063 RepID=A0ABW1ZBT9_9BACT|nr:sialate O-acetylesterase [Granulicella cerasi]